MVEKINKFAVIGNPIDHSISPQIHNLFSNQQKIKIEYFKILSDIKNFKNDVISFFQNGGKGLNVTLPFKELAFEISSNHDESSLSAMAANTLVKKNDEILSFNTDGLGLITDLAKKSIVLEGKKILIIGAGGSAKGILRLISSSNPSSLTIMNRTEKRASALLKKIDTNIETNLYKNDMSFDLVINTTPISLLDSSINFPNNIFNDNSVSYDLYYSKSKTKFQSWSQNSGASMSYSGIGMLIEQAAVSYNIWNNFSPDTSGIAKDLGF